MSLYRITTKAEREIKEILLAIKSDDEGAAKRWHMNLYSKFEMLSAMPDVHMFPFGSYLIFYDIEPTGIVILHVVDARRDVPRLFAKIMRRARKRIGGCVSHPGIVGPSKATLDPGPPYPT